MSDVVIAIKVPQSLLKRAEAAGLNLEAKPEILIEALEDLLDDLDWDHSFADSQDWLTHKAEQVRKDFHEGHTEELDPDTL